MTREERIEAIAAELWRVQALVSWPPDSVAAHRTPQAFSEAHDSTRRVFLKYAAAALDLCGPNDLAWRKGSAIIGGTRFMVAQTDFDDGCGEVWYIYINGKPAGKLGEHNSEAAAQAAAQAHADAAHWANTKMGDV